MDAKYEQRKKMIYDFMCDDMYVPMKIKELAIVLGVKKELVIEKMRSRMPVRFDLASGPCRMDCILFSVDEKTGKTIHLERFQIK